MQGHSRSIQSKGCARVSARCRVYSAGSWVFPAWLESPELDAGYRGSCQAKAIGAVAKTRRKKGKFILVCGQKPGDAQHDIQDTDEWARLTTKIIKDASGWPVVYRPHPAVVAPECSIADALEDATVMVTHNSTSAYQAFVDGVPVVCTDENAAYAGCAQSFDDVFVKGKNIIQRTAKNPAGDT